EISKNTKLIEKTNVYETDGPHNRSTVVFEALELIDDFSRISFRFELLGEDGLLRANVRGGLKLRIDETGFFSQVFSDYYVRTIFPILQKISEDRIKFFGEKIDKLINE
ncbi:MAG TPA: hypothetical protein VJH04_00235, partial [archaeon]|nr:hypothetical protein [archaeon]